MQIIFAHQFDFLPIDRPSSANEVSLSLFAQFCYIYLFRATFNLNTFFFSVYE